MAQLVDCVVTKLVL